MTTTTQTASSTTSSRRVTPADVDAAKGAELRGLYALVTGKATSNKDSTKLRKILHAILEEHEAARPRADAESGPSADELEPGPTTQEIAEEHLERAAAPRLGGVALTDDVEDLDDDQQARVDEIAGRLMEAARAEVTAAVARGARPADCNEALEAFEQGSIGRSDLSAQLARLVAEFGVDEDGRPLAAGGAAKPAKARKPAAAPKPERAPKAKKPAAERPANKRLAKMTAKPAEAPEGAAGGEDDAKRGRTRPLPPNGTVLQKVDRHGNVRAEALVTDEGVVFPSTGRDAKVYESLSGAAMAALRSLGLTTKTVDGWAWWGLKKADPKPRAARALRPGAVGRAIKIGHDHFDRLGKLAAALGAAGDLEEARRLAGHLMDLRARLDQLEITAATALEAASAASEEA